MAKLAGATDFHMDSISRATVDHYSRGRVVLVGDAAYASVSQKVNAGRLLAPGTRWGIRLRNLLFGALALVGPLMKVVDRPASNLVLEDYERFAPAAR
jgi:hypothetical protein